MSEITITAWDSEKKQIRFNYWKALREASKEYYGMVGKPDPEGLGPYILENYGLKMNLDSGQMITAEYTIVDEKKYAIFLLKFM
jgi:hypothetical protein